MTLAQSKHRRGSLVRRRPVERAGPGADRTAHTRPGAGFLPPRLPVARRPRAGYRIYSADDFFHGRDCESLEPHAADPRRRAHRTAGATSVDAGRRFVGWAVVGGTITAVVAILWSAMAVRSTRPAGRASLRSVPSSAGSGRREPAASQRGAMHHAGGGAKNNVHNGRTALGRRRQKAGARARRLSGPRDEPARVVSLPVAGSQSPDASADGTAPSASSAAAPEARPEFGFER
jgi:hypothetical protein